MRSWASPRLRHERRRLLQFGAELRWPPTRQRRRNDGKRQKTSGRALANPRLLSDPCRPVGRQGRLTRNRHTPDDLGGAPLSEYPIKAGKIISRSQDYARKKKIFLDAALEIRVNNLGAYRAPSSSCQWYPQAYPPVGEKLGRPEGTAKSCQLLRRA